MNSHYCIDKCCKYKVIPYNKKIPLEINNNKEKIKKAGSFIYDSKSKKILLVQSRGQMWGCPKGTIKDLENPLECAIREVKEETGIGIDFKELKESVVIDNKVEYFIYKMEENEVCLLALLSKGDIRTNRCTPLSAFKNP